MLASDLIRSPAISRAVHEERNQRLEEFRSDVQPWMERILGINLTPNATTSNGSELALHFLDQLRNGKQLCELANKIRPGLVEKIQSEHASDAMPAMVACENIHNFIKAARALGVLTENLFSWKDLHKNEDPLKVMRCLVYLKRATEASNAAALSSISSSSSSSTLSVGPTHRYELRSTPNISRTRSLLTASARKAQQTLSMFGNGTGSSSTDHGIMTDDSMTVALSASTSASRVAEILKSVEVAKSNAASSSNVSSQDWAVLNTPSRKGRSAMEDNASTVSRRGGRLEAGGVGGGRYTIRETGADRKDMQLERMAMQLREAEAENKRLKKEQASQGNKYAPLVAAASTCFKGVSQSIRTELSSFEDALRKACSQIGAACASHQAKYEKEKKVRRATQEKLVDLQGNIRVFARARPLSDSEISANSGSCIRFVDDTTLVLYDPAEGKTKCADFEFDRVFPPRSTQEEVYDEVSPLVQSAIDGFNVCIFAYGQTGSGKTFTMEGSPSARGVNYRALEQLFDTLRESSIETADVTMSVVEIYNEQVRDLLLDRASYKKAAESSGLDIRLNAKGEVHVPGLTETKVCSVSDVTEIMRTRAFPNRQTSATMMNAQSSRSHSLVFLNINKTNTVTNDTTYGRLVLIDLAGSERVKKSLATGQAMTEAQNINKSLSALGDVIAALKTKEKHTPYRNSKLTFLLQDCLGGNSKCMMFCNVSPADCNYQETSCSLKFAQRVRSTTLGTARKTLSKTTSGASSSSLPSSSSSTGPSAAAMAIAASAKASAESTAQLLKVKEELVATKEEMEKMKKELLSAEEMKKQMMEQIKGLREKLRNAEKESESTKAELNQVLRSRPPTPSMSSSGASSSMSSSSIPTATASHRSQSAKPPRFSVNTGSRSSFSAPPPSLPTPTNASSSSPQSAMFGTTRTHNGSRNIHNLPPSSGRSSPSLPMPMTDDASSSSTSTSTSTSSSSSFAERANQALQQAIENARAGTPMNTTSLFNATSSSSSHSSSNAEEDEWTKVNQQSSSSNSGIPSFDKLTSSSTQSEVEVNDAMNGRPSIGLTSLTARMGTLAFNSNANTITASSLSSSAQQSTLSVDVDNDSSREPGPSPPRKRKSLENDADAPHMDLGALLGIEIASSSSSSSSTSSSTSSATPVFHTPVATPVAGLNPNRQPSITSTAMTASSKTSLGKVEGKTILSHSSSTTTHTTTSSSSLSSSSSSSAPVSHGKFGVAVDRWASQHALLPSVVPAGKSTIGRKGKVFVARVSDAEPLDKDENGRLLNVSMADMTAHGDGYGVDNDENDSGERAKKRVKFGEIVTTTLSTPDVSVCDDSLNASHINIVGTGSLLVPSHLVTANPILNTNSNHTNPSRSNERDPFSKASLFQPTSSSASNIHASSSTLSSSTTKMFAPTRTLGRPTTATATVTSTTTRSTSSSAFSLGVSSTSSSSAGTAKRSLGAPLRRATTASSVTAKTKSR